MADNMADNKVTLHTRMGGTHEVEPERIAVNDVRLPGETGHARLWVVGNEYGPMGAVWATDMQEALDELVDRDLAGGILVDEDSLAGMSEEEVEALALLGNAGEYADLTNTWLYAVEWDPARDWYTLCKLAEARGAGANFLSDVL